LDLDLVISLFSLFCQSSKILVCWANLKLSSSFFFKSDLIILSAIFSVRLLFALKTLELIAISGD